VSERTRIQLCGRLSVEIDGVQVADALRGKQVPLLFAYFVLNRSRAIGREELIGALWPHDAPRSQDAALRTLLSRLRSALGRSAVVGRNDLALELAEPTWIDLEAAFSQLDRARGMLERGDARVAWALAQVPINIAGRGLLPGAHADWLDRRRRELEDLRLQALDVIGRAGLELGGTQLGSAERASRALIEAEPYRESGYVLLMQTLAARGDTAEGLMVFDRLRTLLRDQLGSAPSRETIAAHEALLRPAPRAAQAAAALPRPGLGIELPAELRARSAAPFVGRVRELGEVRRRWARATRGREEPQASAGERHEENPGRLVLLTGEAGIGKTRLLAELARVVHDDGALVLAGRAPEETLVPYQPFLEALRHYVLNAPFGELRSTTREYGSELARLMPELRRRAPDLPPPPDEPASERYRLFEAVVGLLAEISEAVPVLLVLEDLHWADRPTLLLLRHLARAPQSARLLILGAYRANERWSDGFSAALADLRRERLVSQLELAGLDELDTAELIRVRSGQSPSNAFGVALHEETEGNPFFIEEIVRHLGEAGVDLENAGGAVLRRFGLPEGVKEVIARRLSRLDGQSVEWLRVAAVIGRDFDGALLQRVLPFDDDEFLSALEQALAAGVVAESAGSSGSYSFSHALIRETLYDGMSRARVARIHRAVGVALEDQGAEHHLSALAHHFAQTADPEDYERAIRYAREAGEQASAMLAHEEAADHYARALEVLERMRPGSDQRRCEVLLRLGESQVRSGERLLAWQTFREAATLAARLGDGTSMARAAVGASRRYVQPPGVADEELIDLLERALTMISDERSVLRIRVIARLCGALYFSPKHEQMKALSAEATEIANELGTPEALALAAAARRRAYWDREHLSQRLTDATEMLRHATAAGDMELVLQGHAWLVVDLLEQGDIDAVEVQIRAFTEGAERLRQPLYVWNAAVWRAMQELLAGRLEPAERLASAALAAGHQTESVTAPQYYAAQLLAIRREQGRIGELEGAARTLVRENPHRPAWRAGLATLLWDTGRHEEARGEFDALSRAGYEDIPPDGDWMITTVLLAQLCADLEDAERARQLYRLLTPYADGNVVIGLAAVCQGAAGRYLGALARTLGDPELARAHLEQALALNAAMHAPVHVAHTQLDYARLLGPGERAERLISSAEETAQELELELVIARASRLRASLHAPG
jgi:DNA-binding SARP family transcriptional activator/tetratricopeptide (TPR) repeat protein/energy-coupling factor transporter ATP-binding protein EcfA2